MKKENIDYTPHPLTRIPGGSTLVIHWESGKSERQPNCHYPDKYLKAILAKPGVGVIHKALFDGEVIYSNGKFRSV